MEQQRLQEKQANSQKAITAGPAVESSNGEVSAKSEESKKKD